MVTVGPVRAWYWGRDGVLATALADVADRQAQWPGLPPGSIGSLRLILAPDRAAFDSLTGRRLPPWTSGAALPGANTIVIDRSAQDPRAVLRHELAHMALHRYVSRAPRWFDEGYAAHAAGEWGRLTAWQINWRLARAPVPVLSDLDRDLTGGRAEDADVAYALSMSAVQLLERWGGPRGLGPLLVAARAGPGFDQALRASYGMTLDQFETLWRQDLKRRYGWAVLLTSMGFLWGVTAIIVGGAWWLRRRRVQARRASLDQGWEVPEAEPGPVPEDTPSA